MMISIPIKGKKRQRRHPRAKLRQTLLVAWQGGGRRDASRARNLCLGGIYIDARNPANVGDILQLIFDAPQGEVAARAVVRNVHPGRGMGVEFVGMDYFSRRRLHNMLKALLVSEEVAEEIAAK